MNNLGPIKKMAVFSSIFLVLAFGFIFFFAVPLFNEIEGYSQSIIAKNGELEYFNQDLKQAKNFQLLKESLDGNSEKIDNAFANAEAPIDLIKFWEKSAKDDGLTIDIVAIPSPTDSSSEWKVLSFRISLIGDFPRTLRFIDQIENGPYLTQILGISSSLGADGVQTDLKLNAFAN